MKRLVVVVGEPYSGKAAWLSQQVGRAGGGVVVDLEGGKRSIRWGCKKVREALGRADVSVVYFSDDAAVQQGARMSVLKACEDMVDVEMHSVVVNCLGGQLRAEWEREWKRSRVGGLKDGKTQDGAARLAYTPPDVAEGYDVMYRTSQKLLPQSTLSTVGLVLDAAVLVHNGKLRNGIATLLHSWYKIPSSTKVVVVAVPSRAALHKGWCTDAPLLDMLNTLHVSLRSLRAPFPIYMYASLASETHFAAPPACFVEAAGSGAWEPLNLAALDVAYLQHRHSLFLNYTFVVSSTSLLGSSAEKLRKLCGTVGMRYVDANALFSAVASGADVSVVLKKVAERPPEKQAIKGFISEHAPLTEWSHVYPFLDRAGDAEKEELSVRTRRNVTVHRLVMDDADASAFSASVMTLQASTDSKPKPAPADATAAPQPAADDLPQALVVLQEPSVAALYGTDQMARGAKFFRKNLVELLAVEAPGGASPHLEISMTCASADETRTYSVLLGIADPAAAGGGKIVRSQCECEKNIVEGQSVCRHAAACGLYLTLNAVTTPSRAAAPSAAPPVAAPPAIEAPAELADDTPAVCDAAEGVAPALPRHTPRLAIADQLAAVQVAAYPLPGLQTRAKGGHPHLPAFMVEKQGKGAARKAVAGRKRAEPRPASNAPKRPMTSYFYFLKAVRGQVIKDNPGTAAPQLARLQGGLWGQLAAEEKQKYVDMAKADRARYDAEMDAYKQTAEYHTAQAAKDAQRCDRKAQAAAAAAAPAPPVEPLPALGRQDSEARFYAKFQRNTSWRLVEGKGWVHEWDDGDDEDEGDGAGVPPPPAPPAPTPLRGRPGAATPAALEREGTLIGTECLSSAGSLQPLAPLPSPGADRGAAAAAERGQEVPPVRARRAAAAPEATVPQLRSRESTGRAAAPEGSRKETLPRSAAMSMAWDGSCESDDTVDRLTAVTRFASAPLSVGLKRSYTVMEASEPAVSAAAAPEGAAASGTLHSIMDSLGGSLEEEIDDLFFGAKRRKT